MDALEFTVVISTYNRKFLVGNAINSILGQTWAKTEIVVVDDCSTDLTDTYVTSNFESVVYIKQDKNRGPGPARNKGILAARNNWVIILDDDDELMPNSLMIIAQFVSTGEFNSFPVLNFSSSNGSIPKEFMYIGASDYLNGLIKGDFLPVVNKSVFLADGFRYPEIRVGGESLLWIQIAEKYTIPTWNQCVCKVGDEAPERLTSFQNQVNRAKEYAELQDIILEQQYEIMLKYAPGQIIQRYMGSATYWLIHGDRRMARKRILEVFKKGEYVKGTALLILTVLPMRWVKHFFLMYRDRGL